MSLLIEIFKTAANLSSPRLLSQMSSLDRKFQKVHHIGMFVSTTHSIKVQVTPRYLADQSEPKRSQYLFSYEVEIKNLTDSSVQLMRRRWYIQDGQGRTEEVEGSGVVGLQPMIKPGDSFSYSSFCPLTTPTGYMRGSYVMRTPKGDEFEIDIPLFILAEPSHYH